MPGPPADATFSRAGSRLTVHLSGELDQDTVPELTRTILGHVRSDDDEIIVDLAAVAFCDSSGLSMFVQLGHHADRQGIELSFCDPSPILKATFAVCGFTERLRSRSEPHDGLQEPQGFHSPDRRDAPRADASAADEPGRDWIDGDVGSGDHPEQRSTSWVTTRQMM